jgi:hypothetical protein
MRHFFHVFPYKRTLGQTLQICTYGNNQKSKAISVINTRSFRITYARGESNELDMMLLDRFFQVNKVLERDHRYEPTVANKAILNTNKEIASGLKGTKKNGESAQIHWEDVLSAAKSPDECELILNELVISGADLNHPSRWEKLITLYTTAQDRESVIDRMYKAGAYVNLFMWGKLMESYSTPEAREAVLHRIQEAGVNADLKIWILIMKSYQASKDREAVFSRIPEAGLQANVSIWNHLMESYSSPQDRESVLIRMQQASVQANVVSWNTLMKAYVKSEEREAVFNRMQQVGVKADKVTWNTMMHSYSEPKKREAILKYMLATGVQVVDT